MTPAGTAPLPFARVVIVAVVLEALAFLAHGASAEVVIEGHLDDRALEEKLLRLLHCFYPNPALGSRAAVVKPYAHGDDVTL